MSDVTQILKSIEDGNQRAAEELLPLVYEELRRVAAAIMADEKPGQTLQSTALVHEAWLRLVGSNDREKWANQRHFFAAAAEAMRRILIENARMKGSLKRGGNMQRCELLNVPACVNRSPEDLLDLAAALEALAKTDAVAAEIVNLRYFAGLPVPEVSKLLQLSPRTVDRYWAYARAWLHQAITAEGP